MTNCEAIRIMDKDELAKLLSSIMDGKKCPASEKFCDGQRDCVDAILEWLNAESDYIKYLYRYPKKGTLKSDLMKAEEYTKFLRELFTR